MLLHRVVYELFGWEVETIESGLTIGRDGLHRQVRLEGADGARIFVSWAWGRGRTDYFMAYASASFCNDLPEAELDVSSSPTWRSLVGRKVEVKYRDESWQVVEVNSPDSVVYCCSFQCDRVFVTLELSVPAEP